MGIVDIIMSLPPPPLFVKPQSSIKSYIKRPKRASNTNLHSNAWRLIESEFGKDNVLFSFLYL
jgi:hypothetical protein